MSDFMKSFSLLFVFSVLCTLTSIGQETSYSYYFEGNKQLFKKNYEAAVEAYNKGLEMDPNADYLYFNRGNAKFELKNYKGARLDYNKTLMINKEYAEAYYGRGRAKLLLTPPDNSGCKDLKTARRMDFKSAKIALQELCKE